MKLNTYLFFITLSFTACVKDKPSSKAQPPVQLSDSKRIYVVNEGPFGGGGNGSISLYDSGNNEVIENFYEQQNQSQIGNIAQSLNYIEGNYYIVVNNGNKIIVCDKEFKRKAEISGLTSPRYILPITNQKAYVSDLYANAISIVDLNENKIIGSIPCEGKTERMLLFYNKIFITNSERDYVYIVNGLSDKIEDSVFVGIGASSLCRDKNDKVWVLASGLIPVKKGRLSRIDPIANEVEWFADFNTADSPFNLCLNGTKDVLFYLNNSVYKLQIQANSLPTATFVEKETKNFYGLGVNPNDNSIYVADALDYSQRSQVYIYNEDGSERHNFKAGIISNSFYFE
jgi:DNA-binding beta-propeller fold protein YncE